VIQSTFVNDLSKSEPEMVQLAATGQGCFFTAMVVTAVISVALKVAVGAPLNTRVTMCLAAVWGTAGLYAISKLRSRPPPRERTGSLMSTTFSEMAVLLRELRSEYPQCAKYILALCLANNGLVTFTIVFPTYFTIQQKLTAVDITMISGLTVLVGAISCFFFSKVAHKFRVKSVLIFAIAGWGVVTAFIPLFVYKEGDRMAALLLAFVYGFVLALYWSTQYSALVLLLPPEKMGKYTGLFSACKNVTCAFGPTMYAAIAQASNNQRLAIFTSLVPFFALALFPLCATDFQRGAEDARRAAKGAPELPNMLHADSTPKEDKWPVADA
jgi:MFS-type transporter involved in bile tolerance (Atg22 family)